MKVNTDNARGAAGPAATTSFKISMQNVKHNIVNAGRKYRILIKLESNQYAEIMSQRTE